MYRKLSQRRCLCCSRGPVAIDFSCSGGECFASAAAARLCCRLALADYQKLTGVAKRTAFLKQATELAHQGPFDVLKRLQKHDAPFHSLVGNLHHNYIGYVTDSDRVRRLADTVFDQRTSSLTTAERRISQQVNHDYPVLR